MYSDFVKLNEIITPRITWRKTHFSIYNTSETKRVGFQHQVIVYFSVDTNWISFDIQFNLILTPTTPN
jgi:hypothetical protein